MDCQQNNTDPKTDATLDSKEDSSDGNEVISKDGKKDACKIDQTKNGNAAPASTVKCGKPFSIKVIYFLSVQKHFFIIEYN